jgi:pimeloyl-ACP methyl ester carboxylesterase
LLATPFDAWDEADTMAPAIRGWLSLLEPIMRTQDSVPASWLYTFFATLPYADTPEKFARIVALDETDPFFRHFLAVEDWTQSAPPIPAGLLGNILGDVYLSQNWLNASAPDIVTCPVHVVAPKRDLIVPPCCALPLADRLANATLYRPDCGHVGAMAGRAGPAHVWPAMAAWWTGL